MNSPDYSLPILQVSGGKRDRDYHEWFIRHDFAAIGPRGIGKWVHERQNEFKQLGGRSLKPFYQARRGQIVVLTLGNEVKSVGVVEQPAEYVKGSRLFGNWDLSHVMRVRWADPSDKDAQDLLASIDQRYKGRAPRASNLGDGNSSLSDWAIKTVAQLSETSNLLSRPIAEEPGEDPPLRLSVEELLLESGFDEAEATGVIAIIDRSRNLWDSLHERDWNPRSSENEIVALIVVPLLLAIGWDASKLALEWHPRGSLRADVAAFSSQDRTPDSLGLMIEAKSPGTGLVYAKGQLFDYAQDWKTPLVTTDGFSWVHYRSVSDLEPAEIFMPDIRESAEGFIRDLAMLKPHY